MVSSSTASGSLPQRDCPIATIPRRAGTHHGFLLGSGSGIAGSQVLAGSEARALCGVVEEMWVAGAGSRLESAPESMTWSGTGMVKGWVWWGRVIPASSSASMAGRVRRSKLCDVSQNGGAARGYVILG